MAEAAGPSKEKHLAAVRRIEIFLDCLLAEATSNAAHLLDDSYDKVLTPEERQIRQALRDLDKRVAAAVKSTPAWAPIGKLLESLGGHQAPS